MRRIRDYQRVTIILPRRRADAIVVATAGHRLWLEPVRDAQLLHASLPAAAQVSFAHHQQYVLLSGAVAVHATGCVEFRCHDRAQLPNQRRHARLPIDLPAIVTLVDPDGGDAAPVTTSTVDLSGGGLLLAGRNIAASGAIVTVSVELPDDLPDIAARCRVIGTTARGTSLQFLDVEDADAEHRQSIVIAIRRMIARSAYAAQVA